MIRLHIDDRWRRLWNLMALGFLSFLTHRLHPLAPYWRKAVIKRAELRSPSRPNRRIS